MAFQYRLIKSPLFRRFHSPVAFGRGVTKSGSNESTAAGENLLSYSIDRHDHDDVAS